MLLHAFDFLHLVYIEKVSRINFSALICIHENKYWFLLDIEL